MAQVVEQTKTQYCQKKKKKCFEIEAGGLWVQGQPGLHSKILKINKIKKYY
jgi:hypothetical protein